MAKYQYPQDRSGDKGIGKVVIAGLDGLCLAMDWIEKILRKWFNRRK